MIPCAFDGSGKRVVDELFMTGARADDFFSVFGGRLRDGFRRVDRSDIFFLANF